MLFAKCRAQKHSVLSAAHDQQAANQNITTRVLAGLDTGIIFAILHAKETGKTFEAFPQDDPVVKTCSTNKLNKSVVPNTCVENHLQDQKNNQRNNKHGIPSGC